MRAPSDSSRLKDLCRTDRITSPDHTTAYSVWKSFSVTRFIHIDHSFTSFGGHEYDYAMNLLQEAEVSGYSIVLATHQSFRDKERLPQHWQVFSPFPHTIVKNHHLSSAPQYPDRNRHFIGRVCDHYRKWREKRRHRRFSLACEQLFQQIGFEDGDQCFLATFSELDLPGLAEFLQRNPMSIRATWHIQFHFDFALDEPEQSEKRQALEAEVRSRLSEFFALAGTHRVHFYCTTPALAELYDSLGIAPFEYLPFPVNSALKIAPRCAAGPLCVSIAGGSRREKGIHQLGSTLACVSNDPAVAKKVRFVGQMSLRHHRQLMKDLQARSPRSHVEFDKLPHPLPTDAYHELLQNAAIGLFLYDKSQYIRRCSGILQEMLAAGKPVIVPADCWLADQVAEPNYQYLDRLPETASVVHEISSSEVHWQSEGPNLLAQVEVPAGDSLQILVSLNPGDVRKPLRYLHVRGEQRNDSGDCLALEKISLVRRSGDRPLHFLVTPAAGTRNFRIFLQNESCEGIELADELTIRFLDTTDSGLHPSGSIGLISADESQVASLLRDIVSHYDHYLASAQRYAVQWREEHHSRRSIETFQRHTPTITTQHEGDSVNLPTNGSHLPQSERINPPHPTQPKTTTMEKLTVMIPCCNEERTIGACIESVLPFADEILVADSGSTDRTIEVVESYPECRLIRHTWNGYCHFKNWALERASHDWVMCLDADERVTPQLADEICEILKNPPEEIAAYSVAFQTYFLGHRVRFSNWNNRSLRLIRRECRFRVCRVHENVDISKEQTGRLKNPVLHYSIHSYDQFFEKYARYSKLAAEDMYSCGRRASFWNTLVRPFLRFFHLYVIRGGFLDGLVGIQISMFMSFYYSFAKQARLWEMENTIHEPVRSRLSDLVSSKTSETISLDVSKSDSAADKKAA